MKRFTLARKGTPIRTDVHQHLWPVELVDQLRRRSSPPYLRGWTLYLDGEPPYEIDPADHDPAARAALDPDVERVLLSLSSPLGIEGMHPDEARPLIDSYHDGVRALADPFGGWAAATDTDPDLDGLKGLLTDGFCGVQLPAQLLGTPRRIERVSPVLALCAELGRPVLVHPGPATPVIDDDIPAWWPAVVDYPAQMQAAWWAWRAVGRDLVPELRLCFVAGAGLAPVHHERFAARGGGKFVVDREVFVDVSSYRIQGVDALTRALGIDCVVLGSDRPYAQPPDLGPGGLGDAAEHAICVTNPRRLLEGGEPA